MKVTTLACIQGAWLPPLQPVNVVDIGAGTGLLSHMVAQRYNCSIDSVELEDDAFTQLVENTIQNPWNTKINCIHENIMDFANRNSKQYDFIISNPPFFQNQFQSPNTKVNHARHDSGLKLEELIMICSNLLNESGKISILLPPDETKSLIAQGIQYSLFPSNQLVIYNSVKKPPKAIVTILSRISTIPVVDKLIIKQENGDYTPHFINLLKDYYLNL